MKPTRLQFGVRENTTPSGLHASRLAVNLSLAKRHPLHANNSDEMPVRSSALSEAQADISDEDAAAIAATGETIHDSLLLSVQEVAKLLQVPISWVYDHTRPRCGKPLPHIKLGKYLRFLPADITNYLEDARSVHRVLR